MTTRRQAGDNIHAIVPDPEAILRAGHLARRRQRQLDNLERHRQEALAARQARIAARTAAEQAAIANTPPRPPYPTQAYSPAPSIPAGPPSPTRSVEGLRDPRSHTPSPAPSGAARSNSTPPEMSTTIPEIKIQRPGAADGDIPPAQVEREASAARIARLKETLIALSLKTKAPPAPSRPKTDRIDLQRFKTLDGPLFNGPFQAIKPFLKWIHGLQIFFATKDVRHNADKIRIAGSLIRETNTLACYASLINNLVLGSWDGFKKAMFNFALPPLWRTTLRQKIHELRLTDSETFIVYSNRARTLQSMVNFDSVTVSDFDLAEWVSFGVMPELRALITNHQLLRATPFTYSAFKQQVVEFYDSLPKHLTPRSRPTGSLVSATTTPAPKEQKIWRIHAFLDSQGQSHFCKKTCGNAPGTCPGPCDRNYVKIPDSFQTPSKPANYKVPKPWSSASGGPGRATNPPAGRPNNRTAAVAAVEEENLFLELNTASIAAIAAIDEELRLTAEESGQPGSLMDTPTPPNDHPLGPRQQLHPPFILKDYTLIDLANPRSHLTFDRVPFRIGPIGGGYDLILGTPFLSKFQLIVSIPSRHVQCAKSGIKLLDYRSCHPPQTSTNAIHELSLLSEDRNPNWVTVEKKALTDYCDLFQADIPAVSEEAEAERLFWDGSFPEKLQNELSRVRHKIILTDPDAVINKRQYPYPQKHLKAWGQLIDQHKAAGRIR
ncbi:hypothetical protein PCANC_19018 [Puccinia coronata f. sp. avenae]|uniref:Retrotransposon gag domain-containing protein n=1 Tax=Puccinia coronata f. sp. avenae TaxID=200324 RepID=A0A2N5UH78_9BASI|nr:hypothetical protein PCANC_19018 [Puccinia coronata f. sp. avenae]